MQRTWDVEITPQIGYRDDPRLGRVEVRHAQSKVWYTNPQIKESTTQGRLHIGYLPDKFDCVHKLPHTDSLGNERLAEVLVELRRMTGRPLEWGEHHRPWVMVPQSDVVDLDEASGEVEEIE